MQDEKIIKTNLLVSDPDPTNYLSLGCTEGTEPLDNKVIYYRQDLVSLFKSPIQGCSSIFFDFGHIYAIVIRNILLVHAPNYIESQSLWKKKTDSGIR